MSGVQKYDRLLHPRRGSPIVVERPAGVIVAVADLGEAVVLALVDDVDLVAASRPVLAEPERARARMDGDALIVAKAKREDLGTRAGAADERIVVRDRPVGVDPQHFPHVAIEVLRLRPVGGRDAAALGNSGRDEQRAVPRLNQPAARPVTLKQDLDVFQAPSSAERRALATVRMPGDRCGGSGSFPFGSTV